MLQHAWPQRFEAISWLGVWLRTGQSPEVVKLFKAKEGIESGRYLVKDLSVRCERVDEEVERRTMRRLISADAHTHQRQLISIEH